MSVGKYNALTESFSELNRLIIDSQQWKARHETRMAEQGQKRLIAEQQAENMALDNQIKSKAAAEAKWQMTPSDVLVSDFTENQAITGNPDTMERLRLAIDVNSDGIIYNKETNGFNYQDGSSYQMTPMEKARLLPFIDGIEASVTDPIQIAVNQRNEINRAIIDVEGKLKNTPKSIKNAQQSGMLKVQLNKLRAAKVKHSVDSSPQNMRRHYAAKQKIASNLAAKATALGNHQLAATYKDDANRAATLEAKMMGLEISERTATTTKAGQPLLKMAQRIVDGQQVETKYVSVPKNSPSGLTPFGADDTLDNSWSWVEGGKGKILEADTIKVQTDAISTHYGAKWDQGQAIFVDEEKRDMRDAAERLFLKNVDRWEKKNGIYPNNIQLGQIRDKAILKTDEVNEKFWDYVETLDNYSNASDDSLAELLKASEIPVSLDVFKQILETGAKQKDGTIVSGEEFRRDLSLKMETQFETVFGYNPLK